jgi:hypothetical protein
MATEKHTRTPDTEPGANSSVSHHTSRILTTTVCPGPTGTENLWLAQLWLAHIHVLSSGTRQTCKHVMKLMVHHTYNLQPPHVNADA